MKYRFTEWFVRLGHKGESRQYTREPHWEYCRRIAGYCEYYNLKSDIVKAAWLHDVLGRTQCPDWLLRLVFNEAVYQIVFDLTYITTLTDGNRYTRKAIELKRLAKVSKEAAMIELLIRFDNSRTIKAYDPRFYAIYRQETLDVLEVLPEAHRELERELRGMPNH